MEWTSETKARCSAVISFPDGMLVCRPDLLAKHWLRYTTSMTKQSILSNKQLLQEAINVSQSQKGTLEYLGLRPAGGNFANLKKWCKIHDLEVPTATTAYRITVGADFRRKPDSEVFVENSTYNNGTSLKKRLRNIWQSWQCSECGQGEVWNNKPLTLQLEHINGVHTDNRLANLTLLCPNCHTQTETFAGRAR